MEGNDDFFDAGGNVNRAQLETVLDRNLRYQTAYQIALGFLQWSLNQDTPQVVELNGTEIVLASSQNRSDGKDGVELSEDAVKKISDSLNPYDVADEVSRCFAELYDYGNSDFSYCEYYLSNATIELKDAVYLQQIY